MAKRNTNNPTGDDLDSPFCRKTVHSSDGQWACPCPVLPACPLFLPCPPCPLPDKNKTGKCPLARATISMPGAPAGKNGQEPKNINKENYVSSKLLSGAATL